MYVIISTLLAEPSQGFHAKVLMPEMEMEMERGRGIGRDLHAGHNNKTIRLCNKNSILFSVFHSFFGCVQRVRGLDRAQRQNGLAFLPASLVEGSSSTDCGMPQHRHIFIYYWRQRDSSRASSACPGDWAQVLRLRYLCDTLSHSACSYLPCDGAAPLYGGHSHAAGWDCILKRTVEQP